jgi:hypothetical protein
MRHNRVREFEKRYEQKRADAAAGIREQLYEVGEMVSQVVAKHPVACLAAMVSIGVAVGWIAKRR